jgi:hypothetical protein
MFNNNLPVSSLFCKISLLCLPHCLPARIPCTFCSSIFCALCAIPFQCTFCLLCISAAALHLLLHTCITHNNNNLITSLYRVLIASVHLVHAMYTNASACSHHVNLFHISSALSDHHGNPSASLAVFPRVQHHWMSC